MKTFNLTLGAKYIYGILEISINCIIIKTATYKKL